MIRDYINKFNSLIRIGQVLDKTINETIYTGKHASSLGTKLVKWIRSEKGGSSSGKIGESILEPAIDCWHVKITNFNAINGYYWIKPICGVKEIRV